MGLQKAEFTTVPDVHVQIPRAICSTEMSQLLWCGGSALDCADSDTTQLPESETHNNTVGLRSPSVTAVLRCP